MLAWLISWCVACLPASSSMAASVNHKRRLPSGAEQLAHQKQRPSTTNNSNTENASAERPAPAALATLAECATWLSTLQVTQSDEPMRRVAKAITALQAPTSRSQRAEIQGLLKPWGVKQKADTGAKVKASQVRSTLEAKVLQEACRLKVLRDSRNCSSAIAISLQTVELPFNH